VFSRIAATAAVAAATLVATTLLAAPAYAEDAVTVKLDAPGSLTPGRGGSLTVSMQNQTDQEIVRVRTIITVRMAGLPVDAVLVTRGGLPLPRSGEDGSVRFTDALQGRLGPDGRANDESQARYGIVIAPGSPTGDAEIIAEAYADGNRLGGDSDGVEFRAGRGDRSTPAKTTPPNTNPGIVPTFNNPTAEQTFKPLDRGTPLAAVDTGIPFYVYIVGVILLGVGGVLLWLLFRERRPVGAAVAGSVPAGPAAGLGARLARFTGGTPRQPAVHQPTTVLPTVRMPRPASHHLDPPSDPWAGNTGDVFDGRNPKTREFDPFDEPPGGPSRPPRPPRPPRRH
jgi:hypothetical protein